MQLSSIPVPVTYTPVQPIPPVSSVKRDDSQTDLGSAAGQKLRAAPPAGVGSLLDILA